MRAWIAIGAIERSRCRFASSARANENALALARGRATSASPTPRRFSWSTSSSGVPHRRGGAALDRGPGDAPGASADHEPARPAGGDARPVRRGAFAPRAGGGALGRARRSRARRDLGRPLPDREARRRRRRGRARRTPRMRAARGERRAPLPLDPDRRTRPGCSAHSAASHEAEECSRLSEELGTDDDVDTQMLWRQARATALAHRGELARARRLARQALALAEQSDDLNAHGDALSTSPRSSSSPASGQRPRPPWGRRERSTCARATWSWPSASRRGCHGPPGRPAVDEPLPSPSRASRSCVLSFARSVDQKCLYLAEALFSTTSSMYSTSAGMYAQSPADSS